MLLTIIVPAHNVAPYVARCLQSMLEQSDPDVVEIVLVDDGSIDETLRVARQLDVDGHCTFVSQNNSGLGAARNTGLEKAHGDYIWFVDGDDWLKPATLQQVLQKLRGGSYDVLVVNFSCADESGQSIQWIQSPFSNDIGRTMSGSEFFAAYHATTYAWLYIMRRSLLVEHELRFQPRINMQDAEFVPRLLAVANSVHVSGINSYVYVKRAGSFINSVDPEVRERYFRSVLDVRRRLSDFRRGVSDPLMFQGLSAKLAAIQGILLKAFVYDRLEGEGLHARLGLLSGEGVYPFAPLANETLKESMLRRAVNMAPIRFPLAYRWLRGRAVIRKVLHATRILGA